MFGRGLRVYRRGFIWTTLLLCLVMAVAGLLAPVVQLLAPLMEEEGAVLPSVPSAPVLMMRCGLAYEMIGALYAAALGMRVLRREAKRGAIMWDLPVSRAQIVLRHYLAGAFYTILMAVIVGAVSFALLTLSGGAKLGAIIPLLHPALGFLAIYSLIFGIAAVINSGAVLGAAGVLLPVVALLPTCAMLLKPLSGLSVPTELALFLPYGPTGALQIKTIVGAALAVVLPLVVSLGVYSRRSLI